MTENNNRYRIEDFHVIDSNSTPHKRIYIREILDMGSHEYTSSKLSAKQKFEIITELGLAPLTAVLDACYRSNNRPPEEYNASKDAELAFMVLSKAASR